MPSIPNIKIRPTWHTSIHALHCIMLHLHHVAWHLRKNAELWGQHFNWVPRLDRYTTPGRSFPKRTTSQFAVRCSQQLCESFSGRQVSGDHKAEPSSMGGTLWVHEATRKTHVFAEGLSSINLLQLGSQTWVTINLLLFDPWTYYEPINLLGNFNSKQPTTIQCVRRFIGAVKELR